MSAWDEMALAMKNGGKSTSPSASTSVGAQSTSWDQQAVQPLSAVQKMNAKYGIAPPITPKTNWFQNIAIPVGYGMSQVGDILQKYLSYPDLIAGKAFRKNLTKTQAENVPIMERFENAHPLASALGETYGQALPTFPLGEGAASLVGKIASPLLAEEMPLTARIAGRVFPRIGGGAVYGATTPGNPTINIPAGATLGLAGEGGAKLLGTGLGLGVKTAKGVGSLIGEMAFPKEKAVQTVSRILQDAALGTSNPPAPLGHLPINLSLGGQTMDPGLQSMERVVSSSITHGVPNEAAFQAQQRANNAVLSDNLDKFHSPQATFDNAANAGKKALSASHAELKKEENSLWQVPEIQNANVNIPNVYNAARDWYDALPISTQKALGPNGVAPIDELSAIQGRHGIQAPFNEISAWASNLEGTIRKTLKGYPNLQRVMGNLKKAVMDSIGTGSGFNNTETAAGQAYRNATQHTWNIHNVYFPDGNTGPTSSLNVAKWLKTDPAKLMDQVTSTPTTMDAYLRAASQAPDKGASAMQALRDHLALTAKDVSSGSARGGDTPFINGQKLKAWIADKLPVLSKVFSPSEIQRLSDIGEGAYRNIASEAASPRTGSNTLNKYLGENEIKRMMNQTKIGGVAGHVVTSVRDALLGKYQGETQRLLRDAFLNTNEPEITALMSAPPTPQNMAAANKLVTKIISNRYLQNAAKNTKAFAKGTALTGTLRALNRATSGVSTQGNG